MKQNEQNTPEPYAIPTSAKESHAKDGYSPEQLIKRIMIENTPFEIISIQGKHFITHGKLKLSPDFETIEDTKTWFNNNYWEFTINLILALAEWSYKYYEDQKNKIGTTLQ